MHCRSCLYSSVCLSDCIVRRKREIEALTPFSTLPAWLWHSTYAAVHPPTMESQHILFIYRLGCSFHIFIAPVQAESYRVESKLSFCASCVCVYVCRVLIERHIHISIIHFRITRPPNRVCMCLREGDNNTILWGEATHNAWGEQKKTFTNHSIFFPHFHLSHCDQFHSTLFFSCIQSQSSIAEHTPNGHNAC